MSLVGKVLQGLERRSLEAPQSWLSTALGQTPSYSGENVSVDSAFKLVPVYSAVALLAGSIGSLPMIVYRRLEKGRERADTHWTWKLLHVQPNPYMAADELWELVGAHLLLWGNAFIGKIHNNLGALELWPLKPDRVQVGLKTDGTRYFVLDGNDRNPYDDNDILHIRGLGTDGVVGLSPIQQARQSLGNTMALERFSGEFWQKNASPPGMLTHPNKLSPEARDNLRASWKARALAGEIVVGEEGLDWKSIGMPLIDAQFIETANFSTLQIAQLFRLPPYMLGAKTGDSMTYTNTEMQGIDFVRWSLRRWLVRIESSLQRDPSLFVQGQRFYPEFLVDALLRSDTKTRFEAYEIALRAKFLTEDEVREMENRTPMTGTEPDSTPSSPNGVPDQLPTTPEVVA